MADSTEYESGDTSASLARPELSDIVREDDTHVDSQLSLEEDGHGTNNCLPGLERSDDVPNKEDSVGMGCASEHEDVGMNGSSIQGDNDEAGYLRGLAAEVVNQEDLERSVARQVWLRFGGMFTTHC